MLNSGEVPNIFGADEKAEICEKMRVVSVPFLYGKPFAESLNAAWKNSD